MTKTEQLDHLISECRNHIYKVDEIMIKSKGKEIGGKLAGEMNQFQIYLREFNKEICKTTTGKH